MAAAAEPSSSKATDATTTTDPTDLDPSAAEFPRFSPEEEASLLADSNAQKTAANALFTSAAYSDAISAYGRALATCPNYLDYEVAVLRANVAACHLKLSEWKDAVDAATEAVDCLDRVDPPTSAEKRRKRREERAKGVGEKAYRESSGHGVGGSSSAAAAEEDTSEDEDEGDGGVEEVDDDTAARIEALARSGRTRDDVQKLRAKALLRRAKARAELGGWSNLQGADEDYRALAAMPNLAPLDRKAVDAALRTLPAKLDEAKQKEVGEMMGKLKTLGNGLLKPFGLSTDNFQFVKDEKTGGYTVQMNQ